MTPWSARRSRGLSACAECDAPSGRRARFCPRCGANLTARPPAPAPTAAAAPARARGITALDGPPQPPTTAPAPAPSGAVLDRARALAPAAVLVALTVTVAVSLPAGDGPLFLAGPDGQVLPPAAAEEDGAPAVSGLMAEDTRERLAEQQQRRALRCEPGGCELWRAQLAPGNYPAAVGAGVVAVLSDPRADPGGVLLQLLDAASGELTAMVPLPGGDPGGGPEPGASLQFLPDAMGVLLGQTVTVVEPDGRVRFQRTYDQNLDWMVAAASERLFLIAPTAGWGDDGGGAPRRLLALDAQDGDLAWESIGGPVATLDEDVVVVGDRLSGDSVVLRAHDTDTGELLWERRAPHVLAGQADRRLVPVAGAGPDGTDALVEAVSGEVAATVGGRILLTAAAGERDTAVLVAQPGADGTLGREVGPFVGRAAPQDLAVWLLDERGNVRWVTVLNQRLRGFVRMSTWSDDELVVLDEHGIGMSLSRHTGLATPTTGEAVGEGRRLVILDRAGVRVRRERGGLLIREPGATARIVAEEGAAFLVGSDPYVVSNGRTVVAVNPVPDPPA